MAVVNTESTSRQLGRDYKAVVTELRTALLESEIHMQRSQSVLGLIQPRVKGNQKFETLSEKDVGRLRTVTANNKTRRGTLIALHEDICRKKPVGRSNTDNDLLQRAKARVKQLEDMVTLHEALLSWQAWTERKSPDDGDFENLFKAHKFFIKWIERITEKLKEVDSRTSIGFEINGASDARSLVMVTLGFTMTAEQYAMMTLGIILNGFTLAGKAPPLEHYRERIGLTKSFVDRSELMRRMAYEIDGPSNAVRGVQKDILVAQLHSERKALTCCKKLLARQSELLPPIAKSMLDKGVIDQDLAGYLRTTVPNNLRLLSEGLGAMLRTDDAAKASPDDVGRTGKPRLQDIWMQRLRGLLPRLFQQLQILLPAFSNAARALESLELLLEVKCPASEERDDCMRWLRELGQDFDMATERMSELINRVIFDQPDIGQAPASERRIEVEKHLEKIQWQQDSPAAVAEEDAEEEAEEETSPEPAGQASGRTPKSFASWLGELGQNFGLATDRKSEPINELIHEQPDIGEGPASERCIEVENHLEKIQWQQNPPAVVAEEEAEEEAEEKATSPEPAEQASGRTPKSFATTEQEPASVSSAANTETARNNDKKLRQYESLGTLAAQQEQVAAECLKKLRSGDVSGRYSALTVEASLSFAKSYREKQLQKLLQHSEIETSAKLQELRAELDEQIKKLEENSRQWFAQAIALRPTQEAIDRALDKKLTLKVERPVRLPSNRDDDFIHRYVFHIEGHKFKLHVHYRSAHPDLNEKPKKCHYKRYNEDGIDSTRERLYDPDRTLPKEAYRSREAVKGVATARRALQMRDWTPLAQ